MIRIPSCKPHGRMKMAGKSLTTGRAVLYVCRFPRCENYALLMSPSTRLEIEERRRILVRQGRLQKIERRAS